MNINLLVNTLNIFFHNFNKGLNGTTVECTFVAWGLIFTGLCTCTCFSDCQQTTTARFFSSVIVKGSCVRKQDGAQWNVYQFALMADALRKKRKKKAQSLTEANHLPHPPTHDYLHTHTHAQARSLNWDLLSGNKKLLCLATDTKVFSSSGWTSVSSPGL